MQHRRSRSAASRHSAFTLIELLVVIAIIAILAAILFPVFAKAREKARQTTCLSYEKQLGLGVMQYVQDNDESYGPFQWTNPDGTASIPGTRVSWEPVNWMDELQPYLKGGSDTQTWYSTSNTPTTVPSYGIWACPSVPFGSTRYDYAMNDGIFRPAFLTGPSHTQNPMVAMADLPHPADMALIAETGSVEAWSDNGGADLSSDAWWECGNTYHCSGPQSGVIWDADVPNGTHSGSEYMFDQVPRYRHNGVTNLVFADGHVKAIVKNNLDWCKNFYFPKLTSPYDGSSSSWLFGSGNSCYGVNPN